jgi:hypothetical protein
MVSYENYFIGIGFGSCHSNAKACLAKEGQSVLTRNYRHSFSQHSKNKTKMCENILILYLVLLLIIDV